jgi:hypothetical protein
LLNSMRAYLGVGSHWFSNYSHRLTWVLTGRTVAAANLPLPEADMLTAIMMNQFLTKGRSASSIDNFNK